MSRSFLKPWLAYGATLWGGVLISVWLSGGAFGQQVQESNSETVARDVPVGETQVAAVKAAADQIVRLTNDFRKAEGLDPVEPNSSLTEAAQYFAKFMAANDKYGHTADGKQPSERAGQHGYALCIVLENIAYQYRSTGFADDELAQAFTEGWKQSPEHRKNMLDPDVRETGVAVAHSPGSGHYYGVQMFGRPQSAAIRFQIVNRSTKTAHYGLGTRDFVLEPRYTRTHEQCRPPEVVFRGTEAEGESQAVEQVSDGDVFVVSEDSQGALQLERQAAERSTDQ